MSTQRFWGWRRISRLAECGSLAVDVDFHKVPALAGAHPRGILEDCQIALEASRMPQPSLAIASGRGLYLLWFHEPVPRAALPRWNVCQKALWKALKHLGADRRALDAARLLRVVGTTNTNSGLTVEPLSLPGEVWDFDDLADEVLPLTRAGIVDLGIRRAARAARSPAGRTGVAAWGWNAATLWEARLSDLQALRGIRWFGDLPPGHRDDWMFLACNSMSWLAPPERMEREAHALACEVASWEDRETQSRLHAIFKRAQMAAKGETVEWQGVQIDPRYRFKTETIIEWLGITDEEQRQMRNLIAPAEKYRRKREKEKEKRRKGRGGSMSRGELAAWRRAEARKMAAEDVPHDVIAAYLGASVHTVRSYLYGRR
ncbi:MAG: hypothetical protein M3P49_01650 [Actinomycetota bacterium]|nr:hypothetical protein [Actinomycetota bacterium]